MVTHSSFSNLEQVWTSDVRVSVPEQLVLEIHYLKQHQGYFHLNFQNQSSIERIKPINITSRNKRCLNCCRCCSYHRLQNTENKGPHSNPSNNPCMLIVEAKISALYRRVWRHSVYIFRLFGWTGGCILALLFRSRYLFCLRFKALPFCCKTPYCHFCRDDLLDHYSRWGWLKSGI